MGNRDGGEETGDSRRGQELKKMSVKVGAGGKDTLTVGAEDSDTQYLSRSCDSCRHCLLSAAQLLPEAEGYSYLAFRLLLTVQGNDSPA